MKPHRILMRGHTHSQSIEGEERTPKWVQRELDGHAVTKRELTDKQLYDICILAPMGHGVHRHEPGQGDSPVKDNSQ